MPSDRQIEYARSLLFQRGYGSNMNARFKELGASMRQRSGTVLAWLQAMSSAEISALIDKLKGEEGKDG